MSMNGEIALVTGGSRGIGRAICLALAEKGAEVLVNYVSQKQKAEETCDEIIKRGGKAIPIGFDVSDSAGTQAAIDTVVKEKGRVSILVNNAGITRDGLSMRYSVEDWDRVVNTNLRGAFFASQAVMRPMMKNRQGSIINISSIVGVIGNPGQAAYCAAKAGMIGLTKSLAKELASRNIRVNAVAPGFIETDMTHEMTAEQKEQLHKNIPLGRVGKAEEIAAAVAFLASPAANYITGQVLIIDGGLGM
jgi:3-oxoacyl-[acyl-carrier protein] reductase